MPPRRRLRARRSARPKLMRRRYGRKRIYRKRGRPQAVHTFKRGLDGLNQPGNPTVWNSGTTLVTAGRINGTATHLPFLGAWAIDGIQDVINRDEFRNLFDQYRLDKVQLRFYLKYDPGAQAAASANVPRLYYYRDLDDANAPTSLNELKENQYCRERVMSLYRPTVITFRPNCLALLYQTSLTSNYKPAWGQWLDISTFNTRHYGYKFAIDDLTNTNYKVDVEPVLWFSCKHTR